MKKLKNQLLELQKETDPKYKLKQLKILREKLLLQLINKEITHKKENDLKNLLKSICNN